MRKARLHSSELTRERETIAASVEDLRQQHADAIQDAASARQVRGQSLAALTMKALANVQRESSSRLASERAERDAAAAKLEAQLERVRKSKSKFACIVGAAAVIELTLAK